MKVKECIIGFEVEGNKGGNYIKIGKVAKGDNRLFLEIGDCCVVTFRGIITAEMITSFLTQKSFEDNLGLIGVMKRDMAWSKEDTEEMSQGSEELEWHQCPYFIKTD